MLVKENKQLSIFEIWNVFFYNFTTVIVEGLRRLFDGLDIYHSVSTVGNILMSLSMIKFLTMAYIIPVLTGLQADFEQYIFFLHYFKYFLKGLFTKLSKTKIFENLYIKSIYRSNILVFLKTCVQSRMNKCH